ncbi:MAG: FHA domain-containing protein, partial [Chloroflexota bacterium]
KKLLAVGFAAGALVLLILGLGCGEIWAQLEGILKTAQAYPELAFIGSVGCFGALIVFLIILLALWLRRAPPRGTPYLELENAGVRLDLTRDALTLGRGANCDLRLAENLPGVDTVSRQHARLVKRDTRWVVVDGIADDQRSTNGVFVNGKRTLENYLSEGDEIAFGELKLRFRLPTTGLPISQGGAQ